MTTPSHNNYFACKTCGSQFDTMDTLKMHELTHISTHAAEGSPVQQALPQKNSRFAATAILAILIVVTLAQTVYANVILTRLSNGGPAKTTGTSPLPSSLENLPNMVGGC